MRLCPCPCSKKRLSAGRQDELTDLVQDLLPTNAIPEHFLRSTYAVFQVDCRIFDCIAAFDTTNWKRPKRTVNFRLIHIIVSASMLFGASVPWAHVQCIAMVMGGDMEGGHVSVMVVLITRRPFRRVSSNFVAVHDLSAALLRLTGKPSSQHF